MPCSSIFVRAYVHHIFEMVRQLLLGIEVDILPAPRELQSGRAFIKCLEQMATCTFSEEMRYTILTVARKRHNWATMLKCPAFLLAMLATFAGDRVYSKLEQRTIMLDAVAICSFLDLNNPAAQQWHQFFVFTVLWHADPTQSTSIREILNSTDKNSLEAALLLLA